jgi:hypothetical protein
MAMYRVIFSQNKDGEMLFMNIPAEDELEAKHDYRQQHSTEDYCFWGVEEVNEDGSFKDDRKPTEHAIEVVHFADDGALKKDIVFYSGRDRYEVAMAFRRDYSRKKYHIQAIHADASLYA